MSKRSAPADWPEREQQIEREIEAELVRLELEDPCNATRLASASVWGASADITVERRVIRLPHRVALKILRASTDGRTALASLISAMRKRLKADEIDWGAVRIAQKRGKYGRSEKGDSALCERAWMADPDRFGQQEKEMLREVFTEVSLGAPFPEQDEET